MAHAAQHQAPAACWCATCRPVSFGDMRMVLCPVCGNKRCPRASNHIYACTGSNEVGQVGVDVADMAHRAPQCLKYGAAMSPEEIEAIAQRPTYCKADGEAVTLSRAERDALVAMARDGMRWRFGADHRFPVQFTENYPSQGRKFWVNHIESQEEHQTAENAIDAVMAKESP